MLKFVRRNLMNLDLVQVCFNLLGLFLLIAVGFGPAGRGIQRYLRAVLQVFVKGYAALHHLHLPVKAL